MPAWRICKFRHLRTALSGRGAERFGGRWNHPGDRMVYASSSLSLAVLELFVHLDSDLAARDLHWLALRIPDDSTQERLETARLPRDWRRYPGPSMLRDMGAQWLRQRRSLVLIVPSAVNPEEDNLLINPLHPEIRRVTTGRTKPFRFDPRMWN
jgi:RES domain-containing protein